MRSVLIEHLLWAMFYPWDHREVEMRGRDEREPLHTLPPSGKES